jgi:hypothetical protein
MPPMLLMPLPFLPKVVIYGGKESEEVMLEYTKLKVDKRLLHTDDRYGVWTDVSSTEALSRFACTCASLVTRFLFLVATWLFAH